MGHAFQSLFLIAAVAFAAPLLSWIVPRRVIPETVLLLIGGFIIGPNLLGIASVGSSVSFLSELGLTFLFLLAGYEIDVNELRGRGGRHAMVAWLFSLVLAFVAISVLLPNEAVFSDRSIAAAIVLTSTALGTLLPILRERGMLSTAVGVSILNHGAVGEVGPVLVMALLLGTRSPGASAMILAVFTLLTVLILLFTSQVKRMGQRLIEFIHLGGSTTAQTTVRLTVLLLVGLCAVAELFDLDIVLAAFAAGFILRHALPEGNHEYEQKLDGLSYGFFIPIFFVTSGMGVSVSLTADSLIQLGTFFLLLMLVRGVPVWWASFAERKIDGSHVYSTRQCTQISLYSTTALPIIVAVTQVAVEAGTMTQTVASNLIVTGALSVLIMPSAALAFYRKSDRAPANETLGKQQGPELPTDLIEGAACATGTAQAVPSGPLRQRPDPHHPMLGLHGMDLTEDERRFLRERLQQVEIERELWREQIRERSRQHRGPRWRRGR